MMIDELIENKMSARKDPTAKVEGVVMSESAALRPLSFTPSRVLIRLDIQQKLKLVENSVE